jgi:hypothetical protein
MNASRAGRQMPSRRPSDEVSTIWVTRRHCWNSAEHPLEEDPAQMVEEGLELDHTHRPLRRGV